MNTLQLYGLIGVVGGALVLVTQAKARVAEKAAKAEQPVEPACDRPHRCKECGR